MLVWVFRMLLVTHRKSRLTAISCRQMETITKSYRHCIDGQNWPHILVDEKNLHLVFKVHQHEGHLEFLASFLGHL